MTAIQAQEQVRQITTLMSRYKEAAEEKRNTRHNLDRKHIPIFFTEGHKLVIASGSSLMTAPHVRASEPVIKVVADRCGLRMTPAFIVSNERGPLAFREHERSTPAGIYQSLKFMNLEMINLLLFKFNIFLNNAF